jgi:hypothetical protein
MAHWPQPASLDAAMPFIPFGNTKPKLRGCTTLRYIDEQADDRRVLVLLAAMD